MNVQYLNLYVLPNGQIEAGSAKDTVVAAVGAAMPVQCQSYKTLAIISEAGSIQQVATVRKN